MWERRMREGQMREERGCADKGKAQTSKEPEEETRKRGRARTRRKDGEDGEDAQTKLQSLIFGSHHKARNTKRISDNGSLLPLSKTRRIPV